MRSVIVHGVLALAGLVFAYQVWTDETASDADMGEVEMLACRKGQISQVEYKTKEQQVRLEPKKVDGETVVWIRDSRKPKKGKKTEKNFIGSEASEEFLKKLTPMHALRALGKLSKDKRKALSLDKVDTHFRVQCGRQKESFAVGGTAYGSGDRYVQRKSDGEVFLLHADLLRDVQSAEFRLMQRELHRFDNTEVQFLHVDAFSRKAKLMQRNRRVPEKATWVNADNPDKRNELYGNWLSRVGQLRAQTYLKKGAVPGSELKDLTESVSPTTVLKLRYEDEDGDTLGSLELVRIDAKEAVYYAKSELSQVWVTVPKSAAQQVEDDVRPVVGLEAVVRKKEAPTKPTAPAVPGAPGAVQPVPGNPHGAAIKPQGHPPH